MVKRIRTYTLIGPAVMAAVCALVMFANSSGASGPARYTGEPKTIAHDFLEMEKGFGAGAAEAAAVDRLINKAIPRIVVRKSYTTEGAIEILSKIDALLREEGFAFGNNLLLGIGLKKKSIDCDNYCALYIAVAEVLKVPIIPVYAPNHSFLRFCFDDGTYINWETTQGKAQTDSYYIKALRIPEVSIRAGVYMKELTRREFHGVEFNNIGSHLMSARRFGEAAPYFSAAIAAYPRFSSAYHNRGTARYAEKRLREALADLLKANELDPSRGSTHNTLGDIYFDLKDYHRAVNEYTESIRLDPDNYVPYYSIGLVMKEQKKEAEAQKWLRKSMEVKNKRHR